MNRPSLLVIEALVMIGPYLTNSGKFLDASALFGGTVRLAQSIGRKSPSSMIKSCFSFNVLSAPRPTAAESSCTFQRGEDSQESLVVDATYGSAVLNGPGQASSNIKHGRLPTSRTHHY